MKRYIPYLFLVAATLILTTIFQPLSYLQAFAGQLAAPQTQGDCQTFTETGKNLCGKFRQYWNDHGGLAQQGFPISNEFQEKSDLNGQLYTVQYFERSVFELHPENQPPYDVLLSQLGKFQFKAKYPNGEPGAPPPTATPAPPQGVDGQVQLRGDGVYATFQNDNGYVTTGITPNCGFPGKNTMTWAISIVNNSNAPYTAILDRSSVTQSDNNGKQYTLLPEDSGYRCHGAPGIANPVTIPAKGTLNGAISFPIGDLTSATQYFDLRFSMSGTPVAFRYSLR